MMVKIILPLSRLKPLCILNSVTEGFQQCRTLITLN
jgi:hypothetical protein